MMDAVLKARNVLSSDDPLKGSPKEWSIKPLWSLSADRGELYDESLELLSVYLDSGVIPYSEGGSRVHPTSLDMSKYQVVQEGDFVMNNQQAWRGSVGVSTIGGNVSPAYVVLRLSNELDPRYAGYLLRSRPLVDQYMLSSRGVGSIQRQVHRQSLRNVRVPVPPLTEQRRIADYLDEQVRAIDVLQENLGESEGRLNELWKSVRHRLVTGKSQNGKKSVLRETQTWMGDIPSTWSHERFSLHIRATNAGEVIDKSYWGTGDEVLYSCSVRPLISNFPAFPEWKRTELGDILLTRNGTPYVFLPEKESIYTNVVQRIRLSKYLIPDFAFYALNTAAESLLGMGDIIESFNMGVWKRLHLPVPPAEEQKEIVRELRNRNTGIDEARRGIVRLKKHLKEYRQSLITKAVTQGID